MGEFQKLQEKLKMLEHKYVMDITTEKQSFAKEKQSLQKELSNKQKWAVISAQREEKIHFLEQEM